MADPVSITGLILQVGVVLKQLYDYGASVKGAQKELDVLRSELYALKGVLGDIDDGHNTSAAKPMRKDLAQTLASAHELLASLSKNLAPKSSVRGKAIQSLVWPLAKGDHAKVLVKLERIKSSLILYLTNEQRVAAQTQKEDLRDLSTTVRLEIEARRQEALTQAQRKFLQDLAPVSPDVSHSRACSTWQGTHSGSWFIRDSFTPWLTSQHTQASTMAIMGRSGSGKTTLMSRAVEEAYKHSTPGANLATAKFYCSYSDTASQELRNVLGSWTSQLASLTPAIVNEFDTTRAAADVTVQQLEVCIRKAAGAHAGTILLVLDALNESSEQGELYKSITRLTSLSPNIKVLLSTTARTSPPGMHDGSFLVVDMAPHRLMSDMEEYINRCVTKSEVLQAIHRDRLTGRLLRQTDGMFRWLECQMQYLLQQPTVRMALRALDSLPATLNDTYVAILLRVPEAMRDLVKEALVWLASTHRPLTLAELNEAVIIEDGDTDIDETCRLRPADILLTLCQGLVDWYPGTSTVVLAHSSIRTFLKGEHIKTTAAEFYSMTEDGCMRHIMRKCLTYLMLSPFGHTRWSVQLQAIHNEYPLLEYACTRWPLHALRLDLQPDDLHMIIAFFETQRGPVGKTNFLFWIRYLFPACDDVVIETAEPLYYAASYGLTSVVRYMISTGMVSSMPTSRQWYIDHECGRAESTALQVAIYRRHNDIAMRLLEAGADPRSENCEGTSCLRVAELMHNDRGILLLRQSIAASELLSHATSPSSREPALSNETSTGASVEVVWPADDAMVEAAEMEINFLPKSRSDWQGIRLPYFGWRDRLGMLQRSD